MTDGLFPSALRELREDLTKRTAIVVLLSAGVILGISGPFDTFRSLPAFPRVAYWTTVVVLTFVTGSLVSNLVHAALPERAGWPRLVMSTCAVGAAVTAVLSALNLILFGTWHATWSEFLELLGIVTLISGVIEICSFALRADTLSEPERPAPLLERLPLEKRGPLVGLSAEDHYVRVVTRKGTELVLMRLSDAMREVGTTRGLQIHRSHWIALDQIRRITRNGDRGEAVLSDGSIRPISRGYMSAVRAAGLLPRGRTV